MSFDQIRGSDTAAADLLIFISYIEPKAIPRSILPSMESEEEMVHTLSTLFLYAFLSQRESGDTYDMHSLVHLATQVWMQNHELGEDAAGKAMRYVAKVFPTNNHKNRSLWREYMPHALRLVQASGGCRMEERYNLHFGIGRCLQVDRRIREAVDCLERCCSWREATLDETHPDRLGSQPFNYIIYNNWGMPLLIPTGPTARSPRRLRYSKRSWRLGGEHLTRHTQTGSVRSMPLLLPTGPTARSPRRLHAP